VGSKSPLGASMEGEQASVSREAGAHVSRKLGGIYLLKGPDNQCQR
jgi:hypothetical protein